VNKSTPISSPQQKATKTKIKVLVADDSVLMRLLICDILQEDECIEVVGKANNGRQAYIMTCQLEPHVILMDITMGEYGGVYGVEQIMKLAPTPIIILSAMGNTNMEPILEAMSLGAVDYINKPASNNVNLREIKNQLIDKVKVASNIELDEIEEKLDFVNVNSHSFDRNSPYDIIAIGASTGGPRSIETILTHLPSNLNVPVVIVQHMPANFVPSFAARLNNLTPLKVAVAQKGESLKAGHIYLSPGNQNMILRRKKGAVIVDFTHKKYTAYNHPSIDSLMLSLAQVYGQRCIGVVLTGMGRDGADGLLSIKKAGGYTIAQSQETCIVYGMPKVAVDRGGVTEIVHLEEIGGFLVSCLA